MRHNCVPAPEPLHLNAIDPGDGNVAIKHQLRQRPARSYGVLDLRLAASGDHAAEFAEARIAFLVVPFIYSSHGFTSFVTAHWPRPCIPSSSAAVKRNHGIFVTGWFGESNNLSASTGWYRPQ